MSRLKNILLGVFATVLFLPALQQKTNFIHSGRLYGWFTTAPNPTLTLKKWLDGEYCEPKLKYFNDNIGFRPDLIRLSSQLDYSLFTKFRSNKIILDTDLSLLTPEFVDPYLGKDYMGYNAIAGNVTKLKAIQDTLEHLGKTMVLVYTPCKAYFYEPAIPKENKGGRTGPDNYQTYLRLADSLGLKQVDFNAWFLSLKNTSPEVLFPKQGYHWSMYGAQIAADSLTRYIEHRRNILMPRAEWKSVEHSTKPRDSDNDLALTLNLIYPICRENFAYPKIAYGQDRTRTKPKVIYLGDSFLFQWDVDGYMDATNTDWQIWYYFNSLYKTHDPAGETNNPTAATDWMKTLLTSDVLVIMYTPHNLNELGDGFIEKAYDHFFPKS